MLSKARPLNYNNPFANWVINLVHALKMISDIHVNLLILFKSNLTFIHKMVILRIIIKALVTSHSEGSNTLPTPASRNAKTVTKEHNRNQNKCL